MAFNTVKIRELSVADAEKQQNAIDSMIDPILDEVAHRDTLKAFNDRVLSQVRIRSGLEDLALRVIGLEKELEQTRKALFDATRDGSMMTRM